MQKIDVLDHGFVRLVDSMGSDLSIARAARVSYDAAWRAGEDDGSDAKLIRYLWKHKHTTPFEAVEFQFEVRAPIFVFRQWHRHRTWCLRGSTEITCLSPRGAVYKRAIKDIFGLKYGGVVDQMWRTKNGYSENGGAVTRTARLRNPTRTRVLPNCQERVLRVLDTTTELFEAASMRDVYQSGIKEIFEIKTKAGHAVGGSCYHRVYTREGWKKLSELRRGDRVATNGLVAAMERPIPPILRSGIGVWTTMMRSRLINDEDICYVCGGKFLYDDLDLDHVVPVILDLKMALDDNNLKPICMDCHRDKNNAEQIYRQTKTRLGLRWVDIDGKPRRVGEEMTYDISVEGPHHNFIADGLVVHNSYNELSARYRELPEEYYVPAPGKIGVQAKDTKQARAEGAENAVAAGHIRATCEHAFRAYKMLLADGVPRELARSVLPVATYSHMFAKVDLKNLLHFLTLRCDAHAQYEILVYADAMKELIRPIVPVALSAWEQSP